MLSPEEFIGKYRQSWEKIKLFFVRSRGEREMTAERVITCIDGFNLYFGIMSKGWGHYWTNKAVKSTLDNL